MVDSRDEGRHVAGSGGRWEESWAFDFALPDASLGGYVRIGLRPSEGRAWFWAALAGGGRSLVTVREHDIDLPKPGSLEVRASGLWADFICETALEHWTVGIEAFGVSLDDAREAYRGERGDRVAIGLDLEWEALAPAIEPDCASRYEQACTVHGEILEGSTRTDFTGTGWRTHAWGRRDWWSDRWAWAGCHLDDGSAFAGASEDDGDVIAAELTDDGLLRTVTLRSGGRDMTATGVAHAPVLVPSLDGSTRALARSLCRYATPDGHEGVGWAETLTEMPQH